MYASRSLRLFIATILIVGTFYYFLHTKEKSISRLLPETSAADLSTPSSSSSPWKNLAFKYPFKDQIPLPTSKAVRIPRIQYKFSSESRAESKIRKERQRAVKEEFNRSWTAYKDYAWGADELRPISASRKISYGGWAASLVDNLDTLWIMDSKEEFVDAADAALTIDFNAENAAEINVFETTIRYLGGFLAAFDLSRDERLLRKASELGEMLLHAFDTPNHMPLTRWAITKALAGEAQVADQTVLIAEIGSLSLEFTHLSQLTGNPKYYTAIDGITKLLSSEQQMTKIPGLWPTAIDARTPSLTTQNGFTLGGMADSVYEYLPKMHALLAGGDPIYETMFQNFAKAAENIILVRPMLPGDPDVLLAVDAHVPGGTTEPQTSTSGQHLTCFTGGMFAIAGRIFKNDQHVEIGRKLTDGCVWAYKAMPMGMMPEIYSLSLCPSISKSASTKGKSPNCTFSELEWKKAVLRDLPRDSSSTWTMPTTDREIENEADEIIAVQKLPKGFTQVRDSRYQLRPEAIESVFILYRVTGDKKYLEDAWEMFENIRETTRTPFANAVIADVREEKGKVKLIDEMESFWMAETLKVSSFVITTAYYYIDEMLILDVV